MHIHVAGLGPAGAAFALRAISRGHFVTATEPRWPELSWPATYGVIETEVPLWADEWFHASHEVTVRTASTRTLPYRYRMMNKHAFLQALHRAVTSGALRVNQQAPASAGPSANEGFHTAEAVVVAHGATHTDRALWQVAVGYVFSLPAASSSLHSDALEAPDRDATGITPKPRFMDWAEPAHNQAFPPSFLYIQPVDDGILMEETVLATHANPDEIFEELQRRLEGRLKQNNLAEFVRASTLLRTETVAIPMGTRAKAWYRTRGDIHFGASGGLIHPATGYSVGASLQAVDRVLDTLEGVNATKGRNRLNPRNCELAYVLRQLGGELIARADQRTLADFFECFFRLPEGAQLAYLTDHDGVEVMKTMWRLRKETGLWHPFLRPLWKNPRSVFRALKRRMNHYGD